MNHKNITHRIVKVLLWVCMLILLANIVQAWIADVCRIPTNSMEDAIWSGDRIVVRKTACSNTGRNDIIVFNHPNGDGTQLVKRCIGLPGDTVAIRKGEVYINGRMIATPSTVKIPSVDHPVDFPLRSLGWTMNNYGPVVVPAKGMTVTLDTTNIALYRNTIRLEGHEVTCGDSVIYIDGELVIDYKFRADGYFVMGDRRNNSLDSRYWGFVPCESVIGKAVLVYFSSDPEQNNIRWNRVGKRL